MSWRASLSPKFSEIRFFICRNSPKSSGVIDYLAKERNELLMLNPKLRIPITQKVATEEKHYPAKIRFYTSDFQGGELNCDGLDYLQVENKLKTFFEGVRDGKAQNVVQLKPLLKSGEDWQGELLNYFRKQIGPIRREA
jgi:hypothetical protein